MSTLDKFMKMGARKLGIALMFLSVAGFVGFVFAPIVRVGNFDKHRTTFGILSGFLFFVALGLIERAAKFADSNKSGNSENLNKINEIWQKSYDLAKEGKYADAAKFNALQAVRELKVSEPMYCLYTKYAVEMWIKAGEPNKALDEARNILRVYVKNDGAWLKHKSGDYAKNFTSIVSDFFTAEYTAEAAVLAGEVNYQLEKFGLQIRCAAVPVRKNVFPASCTDCGANVFSNPYQDIAQCDYCKAVIYPLKPTPEVKDSKAEAEAARKESIIGLNAVVDAANKSVAAERRIILPPAKPIEKGNRQTSCANTISYTIPLDWKRCSTDVNEHWDDFCSPDNRFVFGFNVNAIRKKEGNMRQEFNKIIAEKPEAKVALKVLDADTPGIFVLSKVDQANLKMDSICWESFPPPNSKGETTVMEIMILFPAEEFELHKQLISDIYGSVKIK